MNIYDYTITAKDGKVIPMSNYKGRTLLIVNTASKCGFTPQYNELQSLYEQYGDKGLDILAFPCNQFMNQEPGNDEEIATFCSVNFGVSFPVFSKVDVNGDSAHPLFKYLKESSPGILGKSIKWNFTKFLVDANGNIVGRYSPATSPLKLKGQIEKLINEVNNGQK